MKADVIHELSGKTVLAVPGVNSLEQALLGSMGFRYGVYLWDPRYKGLDDYIWDCCLEGRRA